MKVAEKFTDTKTVKKISQKHRSQTHKTQKVFNVLFNVLYEKAVEMTFKNFCLLVSPPPSPL